MACRVYACGKGEVEQLKKALEYDPSLDKSLDEEALRKLAADPEKSVIFARQEYGLREGRSMGIDSDDYYLYLKATDEFLAKAETRFAKEFKEVKRATPEIEQKVIRFIEDEEAKANQGFGAIFGGV